MNFKIKQQFDPHGFDLQHQGRHPHYLSNLSHTGDFYSIRVLSLITAYYLIFVLMCYGMVASGFNQSCFFNQEILHSHCLCMSVIYQTGRIFFIFLPSIKLICQDRDEFWIGGGLACNVYSNDQVCVCLQLASAELLLACLH